MHPSTFFSLGAVFIASTSLVQALALITAAPPSPLPTAFLAQREDNGPGPASTCGYLDGDPSKPWIAPKGFSCRIDGINSIWGVCSLGIDFESDCGLGAYCFDSGPCSDGCGPTSLSNNLKVTTRRCPEKDGQTDAKFCSMAQLVVNPGVVYDYIDCAQSPGEATYLLTATAFLEATAVIPSPSSSLPSSSSSSSSRPSLSTVASTTSSGPLPNAPTDRVNNGGGGSDGSNASNTGAIVGGILGGLALVLGSVIALVYLLRHNCGRRRKDERIQEAVDSTSETDWKHGSGGWGPTELASDGRSIPRELPAHSRPGELPAYHAPAWPPVAPVELPATPRS